MTEDVDKLIKALEEGNWKTALRLVKIGEPAVELLIGFLSDENGNDAVDVRWIAAKALGEIGDARAVEPLIELLEDEDSAGRDTDPRGTAARALGKIGDERAVEPLIKGLSGDNWRVRMAAAEALGEIGDARAVEPLIEVLGPFYCQFYEDDEMDVFTAVEALREIGEAAVEPLIKALGDEDSDVRWSAAEALGQIGDVRAVEPLIKTLSDDNWRVRLGGAKALLPYGDERAVEPLIKALGDDNTDPRYRSTGWLCRVRKFAIEALGQIGDERAVEPLIKALSDDYEMVRKAAKEALKKLGHKVE